MHSYPSLTSLTSFLRWHPVLLLCLGLLRVNTANADCQFTDPRMTNTRETHAISLPVGHINLSSLYLQPAGTLLGSGVAPSTLYTYKGADADTPLWICDKDDVEQGKIHFLVSTNADSRFGGYHKIGQADGLEEVYGTWFEYVGLRQIMDGVSLSRDWQKVRLKTWQIVGQKAHIRLQDIPPMQAELYRVSQPVPKGGASPHCGGDRNKQANSVYKCQIATGYVQLAGAVGKDLPHDEEGQDHRKNHDFHSKHNGIAYRLYQGTTLTTSPFCAARSGITQVTFPTISAQALQTGAEIPADFSIEFECHQQTVSGTRREETAIGLQVSPDAFVTAQHLGLVNDANGVDFLVSDRYESDPGLARGVGIRLFQADSPREFLGWTDLIGSNHVKGPRAGWFPVLDGATKIAASGPDHNLFRLDFTAKLAKLPGATVTPGKVRAHANIVIRLQ